MNSYVFNIKCKVEKIVSPWLNWKYQEKCLQEINKRLVSRKHKGVVVVLMLETVAVGLLFFDSTGIAIPTATPAPTTAPKMILPQNASASRAVMRLACSTFKEYPVISPLISAAYLSTSAFAFSTAVLVRFCSPRSAPASPPTPRIR